MGVGRRADESVNRRRRVDFVQLKDGFEFCIRTDNDFKWGTTRQKVGLLSLLLIDVLMKLIVAGALEPACPTGHEAIT